MSRVHALGKVDEPLEKSTLVNDRGNWAWWGEKGKNFQPNRKRRGRNFTAASFMLYCCLFYSGTEGTVEWRKWRFPVLLLFLSPTTTKVNGVVFGFFLSLFPELGWGFLAISWFCLFHHFFHIIPWWAALLFSPLLFSCMVEVDQVTRQQQGSQFHLRLLSLYRAWCSRISTLENCAK